MGEWADRETEGGWGDKWTNSWLGESMVQINSGRVGGWMGRWPAGHVGRGHSWKYSTGAPGPSSLRSPPAPPPLPSSPAQLGNRLTVTSDRARPRTRVASGCQEVWQPSAPSHAAQPSLGVGRGRACHLW